VQGTAAWTELRILDFGCGLAQNSRALAKLCRARGQQVQRLVLADIPTLRREFLIWVGHQTKLPVEILDCTSACPLPPLPHSNVVVATEVFEHLYEPLRYLIAFHEALEPGGYLYTQVADHRPEFMHVSPNLAAVRQKLAQLNYQELYPHQLYQKPLA
jgi:SAM-dependent methyltransferase